MEIEIKKLVSSQEYKKSNIDASSPLTEFQEKCNYNRCLKFTKLLNKGIIEIPCIEFEKNFKKKKKRIIIFKKEALEIKTLFSKFIEKLENQLKKQKKREWEANKGAYWGLSFWLIGSLLVKFTTDHIKWEDAFMFADVQKSLWAIPVLVTASTATVFGLIKAIREISWSSYHADKVSKVIKNIEQADYAEAVLRKLKFTKQ